MNALIAIQVILTLVAAGFWLWMAWDFGGNDHLSGDKRTYWLMAFLLLNVFGAILYYAYEYRKR